MHFLIWVIGNDVAKILEPYTKATARLDWWQVGGRFTGAFKSKYDPRKDPKNRRPCPMYCPAARIDNCAYCHGTGTTVEWPTNWVPFEGDTIAVTELLVLLKNDPPLSLPYAMVSSASGWVENLSWEQTFKETLLSVCNSVPGDTRVTAVDCHN